MRLIAFVLWATFSVFLYQIAGWSYIDNISVSFSDILSLKFNGAYVSKDMILSRYAIIFNMDGSWSGISSDSSVEFFKAPVFAWGALGVSIGSMIQAIKSLFGSE